VISAAYGGRVVSLLALVPAAAVLMVVPGLFVLAILRSPSPERTGHVVKAVGVSMAVLMLAGLLLNSVLPIVGVSRPLAKPEAVATVVVLLIGLGVGAARRVSGTRSSQLVWLPFRLRLPRVRAIAVVATALVPGAAIGAATLNANGSPALSISTEALVAAVAVWLLLTAQRQLDDVPERHKRRRRLSEGTFAWVLFCQATALLLLTSLRGSYLSGHDILSEFAIFTTTLRHARWSMHYSHDPYNGCLSLTVLPVMLSQSLSALASQYIFRLLYQLVFALTPVAAFTIARRFASARHSYMAGFVFLAAPALMRDFPYITRQEIGLFFFAAMIVALGQSKSGTLERRVVLSLLGGGLVLSHYSTAYVAVAILVVALAASFVIRRLQKGTLSTRGGEYVTVGFTGSLLAGVVAWAGLTRTTGDLRSFAVAATQSIGGEGSVVKGIPAYPSLLQSFISTTQRYATRPAGGFYPPATYRGYIAALQVPEALASRLPAQPTVLILKLGEASRFTLQGLMVAGCVLFVARALRAKTPVDFAALAFGALTAIVAASVLPAVGQYYSPLRVYQQALVVLGTSFMVAVCVASSRLPGRLQSPAVAGLVLLAFLSSSPLSAQYLGSPEASVQFNNFGLYYDLYYTHGSELRAIDWLAQHTTSSDIVYADRFATRKITTFSPQPISIVGNVLPYNIGRNAYVFEDVANVTRGVAYDFVDGKEVPYRFPTAFVAQQKHLVFSDGNTRIYR